MTGEPPSGDIPVLPEDLSIEVVLAELKNLVGCRREGDLVRRWDDLRWLPALRTFGAVAGARSVTAKAVAIQKCLQGLRLAGCSAANEGAARALLAVAEKTAKERRRTTAESLGVAVSGFAKYHERNVLTPVAVAILHAHVGGRQLQSVPPFLSWLRASGCAERSVRKASVGPRSWAADAIGDAALLYVAPSFADSPEVDLRVIRASAEPVLPPALAAERESRRARYRSSKGRDLPKLSVDRMALPRSDNGLLTVEGHEELWSSAKAMHQALRSLPAARGKLARDAADYSGARPRVPGILCLHGCVLLEHEHSMHIVWSQRLIYDPDDDAYAPGAWSCSLEEQFIPSMSYADNAARALREELVGTATDALDSPLLAVVLEQSILNVALVTCTIWPGSWQEFLDAHVLAEDPHDVGQLALTPLDAGTLRSLDELGRFSPDAQQRAVPEDEAEFRRNQEWALHETSVLRYALALWLLDTRQLA